MCVAIEVKRSCMSVGTHILKNDPVFLLCAGKHSGLLLTDLVESITSGSKNCCRQAFDIILFVILIQSCAQLNRCRMEMVINYIVERPIYTIVDVEGLGATSPAFSTIDLRGNCCWSLAKVAAWLCDVAELAVETLKFGFKVRNSSIDSFCNFGESWRVFSVTSQVISRETTPNVN